MEKIYCGEEYEGNFDEVYHCVIKIRGMMNKNITTNNWSLIKQVISDEIINLDNYKEIYDSILTNGCYSTMDRKIVIYIMKAIEKKSKHILSISFIDINKRITVFVYRENDINKLKEFFDKEFYNHCLWFHGNLNYDIEKPNLSQHNNILITEKNQLFVVSIGIQ